MCGALHSECSIITNYLMTNAINKKVKKDAKLDSNFTFLLNYIALDF